MPIKLTKTEDKIHDVWVLCHQLHDSITKCEDTVLSKLSILSQQFGVLMAISNLKTIQGTSPNIRDVSLWLDRTHASISLIISRMMKDQLVEKQVDNRDMRKTKLVITKKGEAVLQKALTPAGDLAKDIFGVLSKKEVSTLEKLMGKMLQKTYEIRELKTTDFFVTGLENSKD